MNHTVHGSALYILGFSSLVFYILIFYFIYFYSMTTNPNKINFYFDKNIWADITNMPESERKSFEVLMKPLKEQSIIGIHYSPIGVLELVKGISLEKYYEMNQQEIRLASKITDNHILDNPWDHIKRVAFARGFLKNDIDFDLSFQKLCREISILPYSKIAPKLFELRKSMKWEENWADQLTEIKSKIRKDFGLEPRNQTRRSTTDEFRTTHGLLIRKKRYWHYFCHHYSLPQDLERLSFDSAISNFHSFKYWVDYRIAYENKIIYENKNPKPSDYFD